MSYKASIGAVVAVLEPSIGAGDHFRIGSNTKVMTVTVRMEPAREGKTSLDDRIGECRPEFLARMRSRSLGYPKYQVAYTVTLSWSR